jgi:hypothetical protein
MSRPQPGSQHDAQLPYPAYDDDLVGWASANAALLRAGRLSQVDALHLAEELEDLGKSERRSLASHLCNLMQHLLKWQFQPGLRGPSWRLSVNNARAAAAEILEDSPSLRPALPDLIARLIRLPVATHSPKPASRGDVPERLSLRDRPAPRGCLLA